MTEMPFAAGPVMGLLRATPAGGYAELNGTGTVLTWTAPSDGQLHRVYCFASLVVASLQTGGLVNFSVQLPGGGTANDALFNGGQAAGNYMSFGPGAVVEPGATVTVNQASALTAGAATLYAEIWGS